MNRIHIALAAASVLAMTGVARAGEGNGEPFPGPNTSVTEQVGPSPRYTMGMDAPFNYFYTPSPTAMNDYRQAPGGLDDPYPYKSAGRTVQVAPTEAPPPGISYAHAPQYAPGAPGTRG